MKLIFLDIDGTLTEPGCNVPPDSALEAIRSAQAKGNLVFLCTGRNKVMLEPLLKYGFDGMVAAAGGYVTVRDKVLFDCPMPQEDLRELLEILHRNGVFCTIEGTYRNYGDENLSAFLNTANSVNSEIERWRRALSESLNIFPMKEYDGEPIYKIVIMCEKRDQLREAEEKYGDRYDFVVQEIAAHANCANGELINRAFDKGKGIVRIAEYLNVPMEDTFGFGDSMNDLTMIKTVGTSVCMANGAQALKELSDLVVPSVAEDGLAAGFRQLGLS